MLRITGGTVYDPANQINGEVRDICIVDGRIAESAVGAREIDATGLIIFPGGVDVHTHVAGGAMNFARAMTPEDHRRTQTFIRNQSRRSGIGGMTPSTFATGYLYAGMGWTTVNEAAVPVLSARHTHEELGEIPIVDKSCLVLMANNEIMMDLIQAGEYEKAKDVVAWYVWAAKAYGVKAVSPGGVAAWKWGEDAKQLTSPIAGYHKLTPGDIVKNLARIVDDLQLPHPMHLHCNNLGAPGNISTTIETMKHLEGHRAHIAHLQYHAYGGDDWDTIRSESAQMADYFNAHPHMTTDAGAVLFGDAVTITADGPWQHMLYQLTGRKWGNLDVENETGCGIVPYTYKPSNLVNAVQWAVGLELLLLINDPWRVFLTTDHPNGACFWRYPEIIQLLMSADFRNDCMKILPPQIKSRITLPELTREYTLYEIATITSAGPARALGLAQKGNLGIGKDADLVIYRADKDIARMFGHPRYVIKAGEIVIDDGDIRETPEGQQFISKPQYNPDTDAFLRPRFEDCYSLAFENYPVDISGIEQPEVHDCDANP
ncbi:MULTISPECIES: formylmethanofuran dehydrogenase subunit A [Rosistilla]|uniref:Formyltransferase/hydrolase complex Fhc subunit A n=2 Tax=Rosistilla TaxID=2795779 RepID=A0A518IQ73_9BACT|nr:MULTISPECIES: formylmethanofuran dehydrogenase subunit A [Rosistilla]QDS87098.1 Formyltransferase/hydrolase complex Fhc subunit A [Rosistilla ulvae]QDV55249.1 Formyltransferase/hydrolase complex Fhc subunit A [Rosistilla oblonga]